MQPPSGPAYPPGGAYERPPLPPPRPQAPARPRFLTILFALVFGTFLGSTCVTCATLGRTGGDELVGTGSERVGVVELIGPIVDASTVVRQIREMGSRDDLLGLVVRIDSPGGAVAPSQEIYEAMRWVSREKPVVASMGSMAASGGFWASLGADWVFASPGTITGSIGVITQLPDLRGIAELLHFRMNTFKSGPLKDSGNPFREMTPQDEAHFMGLIHDIYGQFIELTAERRGLDLEKVRALADGRVMTGRAAVEADLVDQLGGLYDAARKVVQLSKIRKAKKAQETITSTTSLEDIEDPTLVYPKKPLPTLLEMLTQSTSRGMSDGVSSAVESVLTRDSAPVELR